MRCTVSTAPDEIRSELRDLNVYRLLERASSYRPGRTPDVISATKFALRTLARRALSLGEEIIADRHDAEDPRRRDRPQSSRLPGSAPTRPRALLVAAGDNPHDSAAKQRSPTSAASHPSTHRSGKHERHRLNRGGDRQANAPSGTS